MYLQDISDCKKKTISPLKYIKLTQLIECSIDKAKFSTSISLNGSIGLMEKYFS